MEKIERRESPKEQSEAETLRAEVRQAVAEAMSNRAKTIRYDRQRKSGQYQGI